MRPASFFLLILLLLLLFFLLPPLLLLLLYYYYYYSTTTTISCSSSSRVVYIRSCNSRVSSGSNRYAFLEKKISKGITDAQSLYTRLKEKIICILTQHVYEITWVNRIHARDTLFSHFSSMFPFNLDFLEF